MASAHPDPVIRDLEIMSPAVNYSRWIYSQFEGAYGRRVVECGAGIGNFTRWLLDRELVIPLDIHPPCVDYMRQRFAGAANVQPRAMDVVGSPDLLQLAEFTPDTIVCFNVLEHIEDDRAALRRMYDLLPPGGKLLLLVPAGPWLYGSMDRRLGHFRRYRRGELAGKLREAGFTIRWLRYMNSVATLPWFVNNRILGHIDEQPAQVMVFDRLFVPWLRPLERLIPPLFGLSLITVAEKSVGQNKG